MPVRVRKVGTSTRKTISYNGNPMQVHKLASGYGVYDKWDDRYVSKHATLSAAKTKAIGLNKEFRKVRSGW